LPKSAGLLLPNFEGAKLLLTFTEDAKEMKQGDKFMEVTLPFIALRVQNQS
jgi:hypothetical protein